MTEGTLLQGSRLRWDAFGVLRARDHLSEAYDTRAGSMLRVSLTPRAYVAGGYLRRWLDSSGKGRHTENRAFGGVTLLLVPNPVRLESVTQYERHFGIAGQPDFNRYRQRIDLEKRFSKAYPFLSEEFTFKHEGLVRARSAAGLRFRWESGVRLEVGYQFESLKTRGAWAPRHSVRTTIHLGESWKRAFRK